MATESVNTELTDAELEELASFGPLIDDDLMQRMEAGASSQSTGIDRRLTLLAMARDADTLSNMSLNDPESFGEMLEGIKRFRDHAEALHGAAEQAWFRMRIADCRAP